MTRKRSPFEIHMDILKAISQESVPTRVMYRVGLTYCCLNQYLTVLIEGGLVAIDGVTDDRRRKRRYVLTDLGQRAIRKIANMKEFEAMFVTAKDWRKPA